jgi:hypothetical protein
MNGTGEKFNAMFRLIVKLRCMAALMLGGWRTTGRAESPAEIWTGIST